MPRMSSSRFRRSSSTAARLREMAARAGCRQGRGRRKRAGHLNFCFAGEKLPTGATPKSRQKPGRKRETYLKSSGPISQSSSCAWRMSSNTSSRTTPNGRVGANSVEASRLRRETRRGNNDNNLYRLCLSKEIPERYVSKRSFKEPLGIGATRTFLKIARDHPPRGSNRPCTCA